MEAIPDILKVKKEAYKEQWALSEWLEKQITLSSFPLPSDC